MYDIGAANIRRELLAIKLFEHDRPPVRIGQEPRCWGLLSEEDRDLYRRMTTRVARGEDPYDYTT